MSKEITVDSNNREARSPLRTPSNAGVTNNVHRANLTGGVVGMFGGSNKRILEKTPSTIVSFTRSPVLVGLCCLMVAMSLGCSQPSDDPEGPSTQIEDYNDFAQATLGAYCEAAFDPSCATPADGDQVALARVLPYRAGSEESCKTSPTLEGYLQTLDFSEDMLLAAAVSRGYVTLDYDAAANCVGAWRAAACELTPSTSAAFEARCDTDVLYTGTVDEGESCALDTGCTGTRCTPDVACIGNMRCDYDSGTCTRECGETTCAGDEICVESSSPYCAPVGLSEGASCQSSLQCAEGLYCDTADTGQCAALIGKGGDCESSAQCQEDMYCFDTGRNDETPGKCVQYSSLNEGERCLDGWGLQDELCASGLYCAETCKSLEAEGDPCQRQGQCASGFVCNVNRSDPEAGTCVRRDRDEGASCTAGRLMCSTGLVCAGPSDNGTCKPALAEGESCFGHGQCRDGLYCQGASRFMASETTGTCRPVKQAGESCDQEWSCSNLYCSGGTCGAT